MSGTLLAKHDVFQNRNVTMLSIFSLSANNLVSLVDFSLGNLSRFIRGNTRREELKGDCFRYIKSLDT